MSLTITVLTDCQVRVYDADSNTWFRGIDLLSARAAPCAVAIEDDGVIAVTGGGAKSSEKIISYFLGQKICFPTYLCT